MMNIAVGLHFSQALNQEKFSGCWPKVEVIYSARLGSLRPLLWINNLPNHLPANGSFITYPPLSAPLIGLIYDWIFSGGN